MSIMYKIVMFLWLFWMVSIFVHALHVFPNTPFSDLEITDKALYDLMTDQQTSSTSLLDYFIKQDVKIVGIEYRFTALSIIGICLGIGLSLSIVKVDIRYLIIGLTAGAMLMMLNSSVSFMKGIIGESSAPTIVLLGILGASILLIFTITFAEKIIGGGDTPND